VLAIGVSVSALVPAAVTCAPVDEAQVAVNARHRGVEVGVAPRDQRRLLRLQPATMFEIQQTLVLSNCITIWRAARRMRMANRAGIGSLRTTGSRAPRQGLPGGIGGGRQLRRALHAGQVRLQGITVDARPPLLHARERACES